MSSRIDQHVSGKIYSQTIVSLTGKIISIMTRSATGIDNFFPGQEPGKMIKSALKYQNAGLNLTIRHAIVKRTNCLRRRRHRLRS